MKYTLLDLCQTIGSSIDSEQINSINDSTESLQIVKIIRTVYYDLINRANLPEHHSLITLDASGTSTKPVLMTVPDNVVQIKWLKYDNATSTDPDINMVLVNHLPLEEFLDRMDSMSESDTNIDSFTHTVGTDTYKFLYRNDRFPMYYTTFDDHTLIFDGYDASIDTTLQKSKTRAYARLSIPFTETDTFVIDLDEPQFALLLNEAKALAWNELKQSQHPKAELNAKRGWLQVGRSKNAVETLSDFDQLPNFGRR